MSVPSMQIYSFVSVNRKKHIVLLHIWTSSLLRSGNEVVSWDMQIRAMRVSAVEQYYALD